MHLLKRIADAGQLRRALFVCDRDELRSQRGVDLAVRIGINTGQATTGAAPDGGVFTSGDTVQLTDDNVRIRAEGNLGADIINTFPAGTQFEVTGDPIDADGYTWYPVTSVDDAAITGWWSAR